jgi:hypothetical protein
VCCVNCSGKLTLEPGSFVLVELVDEVGGARLDLRLANVDTKLPDRVDALGDFGEEWRTPQGTLVAREQWSDGMSRKRHTTHPACNRSNLRTRNAQPR